MVIKLSRKVTYDLDIDIPTLGIKQSKVSLTETEVNQVFREIDNVHSELSNVLGKVNLESKRKYTPRGTTTEAMKKILEYAKTHPLFGVKEIMPVINKADNTTSTILKELYESNQIVLLRKEGTKNVYGPVVSAINVETDNRGNNNHADLAKEAQRLRDSH
jgi:hypothetical protein